MSIKARINLLLNQFGFYPGQFIHSLKGIKPYIDNISKIKKQLKGIGTGFKIERYYPQFSDRFDTAGAIPLHYFYQDVYVANKIFLNNPVKHVDIGSRIDGFVAHVASFRELEVFDIRKLEINVPNIKFIQADLMSTAFNYTDYCDSVSCLHAIEHFGLGRYGDPVDAEGYLKGLLNIYKMLKKNGRFYFSTPIGQQRIEFDAHRVFSVSHLLSLFEGKYKVDSFSFIDDNNNFFHNVMLEPGKIANNFGCSYGCGIFELVKT